MSRLKALAPADAVGGAGFSLLAIGLAGQFSIFVALIAVGLALLLCAFALAFRDSA